MKSGILTSYIRGDIPIFTETSGGKCVLPRKKN